MSAAAAPGDRLLTMPQKPPKWTLGFEAIRWAMEYLVQPNGPNAGKPWQPVDTQILFFLLWYALDEDGNWIYRRAIRRLAKGSGKSPFAAVMALVELCAPVRFKAWDSSRPGGVIGQPVSMPLVQIAATTEAQTENTMRMVRAFAAKGTKLQRAYDLNTLQQHVFKPGGGKLHILTGSAKSAEGGEATFIVGDEGEHWLPSNGGPEFMATLADNLAKSGSRMLETCNAWMPGIESVAEQSWNDWLKQEEGRSKGKTQILYDARIAPADMEERLDEDAYVLECLRHVYGDCYWADLDAILERIQDSRADDAMRKYGNRPTAAEDAWITQAEWSQLSSVDQDGNDARPVVPGEAVVLFFDGSKSGDATALVGCCMSDGHVFLVDCWELKPDEEVNTHLVDLAVKAAFETYEVVAFFADVREWEGYVKGNWADEYGEDLIVWANRTGKDPQPIAWDMRSGAHAMDFVKAVEQCEEEIYQKAFTHDGNAVLARHVTNARRRPYKRFGMSIGKEGKDSPSKVDAAVCMVGARMVRRLVLADKDWQKKMRRRNRGPVKVTVWR